MLLDSQIALHVDELEEVVGSVFLTMMGLETEARRDDKADPVSPALLSAAVYLAGEWQGAVLIHCLPLQAREFAAGFLGMPAPEHVDDDVRDVLGELANMIAGNLKCTLCPGIRISVPSIVEGDTYATHLGDARAIYRSGFATPHGPFWISLFNGREV